MVKEKFPNIIYQGESFTVEFIMALRKYRRAQMKYGRAHKYRLTMSYAMVKLTFVPKIVYLQV